MGIFSKMKGILTNSHTSNPPSKIRSISIQKEKENKKASLNETFFWIFMREISTWWDDTAETKELNSTRFDGDMPIFEVGCYVLFRLDVWFFTNEIPHDLRQAFMSSLIDSFIELYVEETDLSNAGEIFDNRQLIYSKKIKEGEELPIESFLFDLQQLILLTNNDQAPKVADVKPFAMDLDLGRSKSVKLNVMLFEKHMIPALFKSVENGLSTLGK